MWKTSDIRDQNGKTALFVALEESAPVSVVEFLLEHGADVNIFTNEFLSPVSVCLSQFSSYRDCQDKVDSLESELRAGGKTDAEEAKLKEKIRNQTTKDIWPLIREDFEASSAPYDQLHCRRNQRQQAGNVAFGCCHLFGSATNESCRLDATYQIALCSWRRS